MKLEFLNPIRWKKSVLVLLLSGFVVTWFTFVDSYSLSTRWDLHQRKEDLKIRTERLNLTSQELAKKIERMNENEALLEKIAREEYGMRKPGETVYKIRRK